MTLAEFKAWFEGFTEDMDGPPNEKQWKRIKARVKDINGEITTYPIYIDRYWPLRPLRLSVPAPRRTPVWEPYITFGDTAAQTNGGWAGSEGGMSVGSMVDLGRADYQAL